MAFSLGLLNARNQFIRYLLAGGLAALANYASRFFFSVWFPFEIAVSLAFFVGLCTGFVLMRRYAFQAGKRSAVAQAVAYVAVNMLALVQTVVISSALLRLAFPALGVHDHAEALAHAAGVALPVLTSYFGHKLLTFR